MDNIDFGDIEKQIGDLAKTLLRGFVNQAKQDGQQFLEDSKDTFITLTKQLKDGEIRKTNYENSLINLAALAKMERLKQMGLAQVAIDKFTNGVIDILITAGTKAIRL